MKELSIEQKAKAYDEAIKRIQSYVVDEYGCTRIKVVNVFPELKENEDEKIRKEIIRIVDGYFPDKTSIQREKYIAWLEKQDEKKPIDKIQLGKKYKCIASPRYTMFMIGEIYKPEDEFLCSLMNFFYDFFEPIEDGEHKPINEVELKFKVGDWVILNENHNSIYQVKKIENCHYVLRHILGGTFRIPFGSENSMRLWTIKDAKEGDMIYEKSTESIILFKSDDCDWIDSHCSYWQKTKIFERGKRQYGRVSEMNICPSTKEQRDLFFQRMHEAGYDWDAEKKEVIKL